MFLKVNRDGVFVKTRLNMGQILRLRRQKPSSLRMTSWDGCRSIGVNHLHSFKTSRLRLWKQNASATGANMNLGCPTADA